VLAAVAVAPVEGASLLPSPAWTWLPLTLQSIPGCLRGEWRSGNCSLQLLENDEPLLKLATSVPVSFHPLGLGRRQPTPVNVAGGLRDRSRR
jgi:hypothetical protein